MQKLKETYFYLHGHQRYFLYDEAALYNEAVQRVGFQYHYHAIEYCLQPVERLPYLISGRLYHLNLEEVHLKYKS